VGVRTLRLLAAPWPLGLGRRLGLGPPVRFLRRPLLGPALGLGWLGLAPALGLGSGLGWRLGLAPALGLASPLVVTPTLATPTAAQRRRDA
jgi:hypothetical protein